jgi:hypothetical protein
MIFNCGARRSGTYWLQRIVCAHPDVAEIASETLLFSEGIAPLMERFHHGARNAPETATVFIERDVLLDRLRELCDAVFLAQADEGAPHIAERSSLHVQHVELIAELYPDARVVHIIRDGRDVARSLISQRWGPETVADAAAEWRESVLAGRRGAHDGYLEVRYEDLLADPDGGVQGLYERLGLTTTGDAVARGAAEARREGNVDPGSPQVGAGKWRAAFTTGDLRTFEAVAGDLLDELGYPRAAAAGSRPGVRQRARRAVSRGRDTMRRVRGVEKPPDASYHLILNQRVLNRLLGWLHAGRPDRAQELLPASLEVTVVSPDGERTARGAEGLALAIEELQADTAFRRRQLRGEIVPGIPRLGARLVYEDEDGALLEREVYATFDDGRLVRLELRR